jgi:hypothetical protein
MTDFLGADYNHGKKKVKSTEADENDSDSQPNFLLRSTTTADGNVIYRVYSPRKNPPNKPCSSISNNNTPPLVNCFVTPCWKKDEDIVDDQPFEDPSLHKDKIRKTSLGSFVMTLTSLLRTSTKYRKGQDENKLSGRSTESHLNFLRFSGNNSAPKRSSLPILKTKIHPVENPGPSPTGKSNRKTGRTVSTLRTMSTRTRKAHR